MTSEGGFMKSSLPLVYARYGDVGEQRPRYGGGIFTFRRQIKNIQAVQGGESGTIQYKGQSIPVYRRTGGAWDTNPSVLGPVKVTRFHFH
jgi:hypothetical protein